MTVSLDVLVSDGSAGEEPMAQFAAAFLLSLPDHLKILLLRCCSENRISIGDLLQEMLAAFFNVDPTPPPPKKERHLKSVK